MIYRLICISLLLIGLKANGQNTFFKQFVPLATGTEFTPVIFSGKLDTQIVVADSKLIIKYNAHTGNIANAKQLWKYNAAIATHTAIQTGNSLYLGGRAEDSSRIAGFLMKYNLLTGAPVLQTLLYYGGYPLPITAITSDGHQYLYAVSSWFDSTANITKLVVLKMDSSLSLVWAKQLQTSGISFSPSTIHYNNDSAIFISGTYFNSIYGHVVLAVMDSAGTVRHSKDVLCTSGPRIQACIAGILNGHYVTVFKTYIGPSDPGPAIISIWDNHLSSIQTKGLKGIDPVNISCTSNEFVLSGQAPRTSGFIGFRAMRIDDRLNVKAARYFNAIATSSGGNHTHSYLSDSGLAYHYFQVNGYNQIHVAKTDSMQATYCGDTTFNPATTSFSYTDSAITITDTPITIRLKSFVAYAMDNAILSHTSCEPTAVNEVIDNSANFSIYPNPTNGILYISYTGKGQYTTEVTDAAGRTLMNNSDVNTIDVGHLAAGIYFLHFHQGLLHDVRTFVKE